MCLNCLPTFERCLFCVKLKPAVVILSTIGLMVSIFLIVLVNMDPQVLGFNDYMFADWFCAVMILGMVSCVLLMVGWMRLVKNEDARDIILQVHFWWVVATALVYLSFTITFLVMCWNECLMIAVTHISVFAAILIVLPYLLLITNSYRMSLF